MPAAALNLEWTRGVIPKTACRRSGKGIRGMPVGTPDKPSFDTYKESWKPLPTRRKWQSACMKSAADEFYSEYGLTDVKRWVRQYHNGAPLCPSKLFAVEKYLEENPLIARRQRAI